MARLIRPLRRTLLSPYSKTLIPQLQSQHHHHEIPIFLLSQTTSRRYISEMHQAALENKLTRCLRNEIQYEFDHSPPKQLISKYESFTINNRPGEQWINLKRTFWDEEINIEVTMVHAAALPKAIDEEIKLQLTLIVNIAKDEDVLEIICSAGPDSLKINNLFTRKNDLSNVPAKPYFGPEFEDLDDDLQESLYVFLETRGIDDELAAFLHEYMKNKAKSEYIGWMESVESFIQKK